MKIEKVATGNGEKSGRNKRSNELTAEKKWQTKFHNLHEKSIENQASWKKRQTVMQNGSDTPQSIDFEK